MLQVIYCSHNTMELVEVSHKERKNDEYLLAFNYKAHPILFVVEKL